MLEQDRYQKSPKLYVIGLTMLVLFWVFILYSLYIIPFLIWDLRYDIPELVLSWLFYLQFDLGMSVRLSKVLTFLTYALPALVFMLISSIISNYIDNKIVREEENKVRTSIPVDEAPQPTSAALGPIKQDISFATKLVLLMLVALVVLFTVEWLISVPAPAS
ncbi:hypothetical protein [Legionella sp. W05-934-2]|jgi:hypothetical protein|uniref:hypothetical protein n=1 Tax=Legionella sp. W05-934-2 TaxID=1198649 RepID=UPI003462B02D